MAAFKFVTAVALICAGSLTVLPSVEAGASCNWVLFKEYDFSTGYNNEIVVLRTDLQQNMTATHDSGEGAVVLSTMGLLQEEGISLGNWYAFGLSYGTQHSLGIVKVTIEAKASKAIRFVASRQAGGSVGAQFAELTTSYATYELKYLLGYWLHAGTRDFDCAHAMSLSPVSPNGDGLVGKGVEVYIKTIKIEFQKIDLDLEDGRKTLSGQPLTLCPN